MQLSHHKASGPKNWGLVKESTAKIEAAGGQVLGTVTRSTHFVVVGAEPGVKLAQAREFGVTLLDEAALVALLEEK